MSWYCKKERKKITSYFTLKNNDLFSFPWHVQIAWFFRTVGFTNGFQHQNLYEFPPPQKKTLKIKKAEKCYELDSCESFDFPFLFYSDNKNKTKNDILDAKAAVINLELNSFLMIDGLIRFNLCFGISPFPFKSLENKSPSPFAKIINLR